MRELPFSQIPQGHFAFVDASSLGTMHDPHHLDFLKSKPIDLDTYRYPWFPDLYERPKLYLVELLARSIVYDAIIADIKAIESLGINPGDLIRDCDWLSLTMVPDSVYHQAKHVIGEFVTQHKQLNGLAAGWLESNEWFDGFEKLYHDRLHKSLLADDFTADSSNSAARLIYYLEIAQTASVPALLHPAKDEFLGELAGHLYRDALSIVCDRVDKTMRAKMSAQLAQAFGDSAVLNAPPIVDMLIRESHDRKKSLWETASELRQEDDAIAFRKLLRDLHRLLLTPDRRNMVQIQSQLERLGTVVNQWADRFNGKYGIRYVPRTLKIEAIPVVGWVLKLAGLDKVTIPDYLLSPAPAYLRFISRWYF